MSAAADNLRSLPDGGRRAPRFFAGLMLEEELCAPLLEAFEGSLGPEPPGLRWYGVGDLHATLFFFGPLEPALQEQLGEALERELAGAVAPRLAIVRTGSFGRRGRERILWAGLSGDSELRLADLHARVVRVAGSHGFPPQTRPFQPHITLARVRTGRRSGRRPAPVPAAFHELPLELPWTPGAVALARSRSAVGSGTGAGRAYEVVRRFELTAPRP